MPTIINVNIKMIKHHCRMIDFILMEQRSLKRFIEVAKLDDILFLNNFKTVHVTKKICQATICDMKNFLVALKI